METARNNFDLRMLKNAFERDAAGFSFQEWFGVDYSDGAIRAGDARQGSVPARPPPPPPGPPLMTLVHVRVSVTIASPAAGADVQMHMSEGCRR